MHELTLSWLGICHCLWKMIPSALDSGTHVDVVLLQILAKRNTKRNHVQMPTVTEQRLQKLEKYYASLSQFLD